MAASPLPSRGPKRGQNCYVTPLFSGVPNAKHGEKFRSGCLTPAFSGAQKRAELLRNPSILGGPQRQAGRKSEVVASPLPPAPPCISYANVRNYYGPYAHCSLDKGVACVQHIQLLAHTCACAWYECTLSSAHISKCMQTQESLGNMKISGPHPCWHKQ